MTSDNNDSQLWFYCSAAGHDDPCDTWSEHRRRLDEKYKIIEAQLKYLDDIRKQGKVSQQASESGQASLAGTPFPQPNVIPEVDTDTPVVVEWFSEQDTGWGICWHSTDHKVWPTGSRRLQFKEDCRARSIQTYKPRKVELYFDGEPDEWNKWR